MPELDGVDLKTSTSL